MAKKVRYLWDGPRGKDYVRAFYEQRSGVAVQVWKGRKKPDGEPDGDWLMPRVLGLSTCIDQAVAQTEKRKRGAP